ncbi:CheR family methyltransferase [Desulfobacterales bacterium HSG16]|nr:CheR family methyltransferase [Desulfobacterales bacterium HSG16]
MVSMIQTRIESMVENRIGLSASAIGSDVIAKAIDRRMKIFGMNKIDTYLDSLERSGKEWNELIELLVVPETWFFRNRESFIFLSHYITSQWPLKHKNRVLRVLSIPCATGEEPYSIAITLMDAGMEENQYFIDAVDISSIALDKAKEGVFGPESFRGRNLSFRDRNFEPVVNDREKRFVLKPSVRQKVRFLQGNLINSNILANEMPYDIIFCRNLLIYLSVKAKQKVVHNIGRMLARNGILFVGHVERPLVGNSEFTWIREPSVFACTKKKLSIKDKSSDLRKKTPRRKQKVFSSKKVPASSRFASAGVHKKPDNAKMSCQQPSFLQKPPLGIEEHDNLSNNEKIMKMATLHADQGDLEKARKLCKECLNENSLMIPANFLMGLICQAMNEEDKAEKYFNKTVYLDPNHYEALGHLAFIMERRGEPGRAVQLRLRADRILKREGATIENEE